MTTTTLEAPAADTIALVDEWAPTPADIEFPDDTASRIRAPKPDAPPADDEDDVVTTDQRVKKFRTKYPNGAIRTEIQETQSGYMVTAYVWCHGPEESGEGPDSMGHAARRFDEHDVITAHRPLETAETVAIGRALRFLGVEPPKPAKPRKPRSQA